ncbi:hypothetical protein J4709_01990 [Actinomadura sp. LCR2-06]|uniref:DUF6458 domain-containing protein n=2 Tax=Actinomadura violacea TaxID=2819934 RepID=A0ABS3RI02_9ACTN|nr:hypothetical protein [Actinomadura violacea]
MMPMAGGMALLTIGAVLAFAVTGSLRGIDLQTVGAILMVAGAILLLLHLVVRGRPRPKRWSARSRQDAMDDADRGPGRRGVRDDHER